MPRINFSLNIQRSRWQWYVSGAVVLVGALLLFAYITFVQASAAFAEGGATIESFQRAFGERLVKGLMLVLTMGLFLFFFTIQDYRMAFNNLIERLSFTQDGALDNETAAHDLETGKTGVVIRGAYSGDLEMIESSVESMLNENRAYRDRLDAQRGELRDDFILRLMKGWIKDTPVSRRMCRSFDLELLESQYIVVVTGLSSLGSSSSLHEDSITMAYLLMRQQLELMLQHLLKVRALVVDGKLACLIQPEQMVDLSNTQTFSDLVSAIKLSQQMVFDETRIILQSAVGNIDTGLSGVCESFSEATNNYEYAQLIGDGCSVAMSYDNVEQEEDELLGSSWSKLERQVMNCVDAEEYSHAGQLFAEMLESGYISKAPTLALAQHRMLNLTNLLVDAVEVAGAAVGWDAEELQAVQNRVLSSQSLTKLQLTASDIFATLEYQSSSRQRQSSYLRIMDIIDHIEANYHDANLCVNQIAAQFELNPSYLSRTFKKLMCVGLSDYIRRIRIQKAKELLRDGSVSVKQAAELVGFSNVLTMNRAFRKEEGTTAGRLRKLLPDEDEAPVADNQ